MENLSYENIKTRAMELRKKADGTDWSLGDLCVDLGELLAVSKLKVKEANELGETPDSEALELTRSGKDLLKRLASDIGVGVEYLDARRRVSLRIPKEGPLSWIRESSLSFTHCRALYPIKDDAQLDSMAQKGLTLTVEQLRNEVAVFNDNISISSGLYHCVQCSNSIDSPDNMFSVRKGRQTTLLCSPSCLSTWALSLEVGSEPVDFEKELSEVLI